jgi:hypothetical protein
VAIGANLHGDLRAISRESLVYGIVYNFPNEVMQPPGPGRADVHPRTPFDGLKTLQNLYGTCIVIAFGILGNRVSHQRTEPSLIELNQRLRWD